MLQILLKIEDLKNITKKQKSFITGLSYNGFILAGESAVSIIRDREFTELNFYVMGDFNDIFKNNFEFENATYAYYYNHVQITVPNLPVIRVIKTNYLLPEDIINSFDFPCIKTFYNGTEIYATSLCLETLLTRNINNVNPTSIERYQKALRSGYTFNEEIKKNCPFFKKTIDMSYCITFSENTSKNELFNTKFF